MDLTQISISILLLLVVLSPLPLFSWLWKVQVRKALQSLAHTNRLDITCYEIWGDKVICLTRQHVLLYVAHSLSENRTLVIPLTRQSRCHVTKTLDLILLEILTIPNGPGESIELFNSSKDNPAEMKSQHVLALKWQALIKESAAHATDKGND